MLSLQEKEAIIEKIKFEREIRDTVSGSPPKKKHWTENQLVLLIIGAIVTGILVPIFQFNQKSIEWKRQIRYENYSFKMNYMRDCLREFVILESYNSQIYEQAKPFLYEQAPGKSQFEYFKTVFREIQEKRFGQIARITSLTIYFPNQETLAKLFQNYVEASFLYILEIEQFVLRFEEKSSQQDKDAVLSSLDKKTLDLNELYTQIIRTMKTDMQEEGARYEKLSH